jgi:hypothetical protein
MTQDEAVLQQLPCALADRRGSVHVLGPQEFAAVRQRVYEAHAREVATGEAERVLGHGFPEAGFQEFQECPDSRL